MCLKQIKMSSTIRNNKLNPIIESLSKDDSSEIDTACISNESSEYSDIESIDNTTKRRTYTLTEILVENSQYTGRALLIRKLLSLGLLINKCNKCGLDPIWREKPLALQLDHINGVNNDNRIENLRMLCPNCHSQTSTFTGRNKKIYCKKDSHLK
jgi:Zn finger protein HypA/HybF involved in hydrogenase expression